MFTNYVSNIRHKIDFHYKMLSLMPKETSQCSALTHILLFISISRCRSWWSRDSRHGLASFFGSISCTLVATCAFNRSESWWSNGKTSVRRQQATNYQAACQFSSDMQTKLEGKGKTKPEWILILTSQCPLSNEWRSGMNRLRSFNIMNVSTHENAWTVPF